MTVGKRSVWGDYRTRLSRRGGKLETRAPTHRSFEHSGKLVALLVRIEDLQTKRAGLEPFKSPI